MRGLVVHVCLSFLAAGVGAGCMGPAGPDPLPSDSPGPTGAMTRVPTTTTTGAPANQANDWVLVEAITGCGNICFEPTLSWLPNGSLLVAAGSALGKVPWMSSSHDGGRTFAPLATAPEKAESPWSLVCGGDLSDVTVQSDADGSLYVTGLFGLTRRLCGGQAPNIPLEIMLSRSDDGGKTWGLNQVHSPPLPAATASVPDRQWLGLGNHATMYLACTCPLLTTPHVMRSDDGGSTWGDPVPITTAQDHAGPLGPLAVAEDGRVASAFLVRQVNRTTVSVVESSDGAATWQRTDIPSVVGDCCGFPGLAVHGNDFHLTWIDDQNRAVLSTSKMGGPWSAPVAWSGASPVFYPQPWPAIRADGGLAVAWFARNSTGLEVQVSVGIPESGPTETFTVTALEGAPNTDFPIVAWSLDGRLAVAWAQRTGAEGAIWVATKPVGR